MQTTERVSVAVKRDHLQDLAKARKPTLAVAELIWNSLDADASRVEVAFQRNALDGIDEIFVRDNGEGFSPDTVKNGFSSLGGSWKREARKTRSGRALHGKNGKGRFKAFALGSRVEWRSQYEQNGELKSCKVLWDGAQIDKFELSPEGTLEGNRKGTSIRISSIYQNLQGIAGATARAEITEHFAPYLFEYPSVVVIYDGERLDPDSVCSKREEIAVTATVEDEIFDAKLLIVEWNKQTTRSLCLCDETGFTFKEMLPGIQAPGFHFTAYLKAAVLRDLHESGALDLSELHPTVRALSDAARDEMKRYFRERTAQVASETVKKWRAQEIYPFESEPRSEVERAERQVFDVCALHIGEYLPSFEREEQKAKRLTFRLLRQAIERGPGETQRILAEVLDLPVQKQQELARLLDRTTLSAIINASSKIADRLEFLKGLEILLFGKTRETLLERTQLHRILIDNTWIFGEEFHLAVDDESLTTVLVKHLELLGNDREVGDPVLDLGGSQRIVDVMLSRRIPQPLEEMRHHLVIELKRPSKKIDMAVVNQIKTYAFSVADDERFRATRTKWSFWALSNDMDKFAKHDASQRDRPPGMIHDAENYQIWAMTWGQVIEQCRGRLAFFQKQLEYSASEESALGFLRQTYNKYLPDGAHISAALPAPEPSSGLALPESPPTAPALPESPSAQGARLPRRPRRAHERS